MYDWHTLYTETIMGHFDDHDIGDKARKVWTGWKAAVLIAAVIAVGFFIVTSVAADDDPPQTTLLRCTGSLPSLSLRDNGDCHEVQVTATELDHADRIGYEAQGFMHFFQVSGDSACIFTRDRHGDPVSGRSVHPEEHVQVAYISEGYAAFAITGRNCLGAGVGYCNGLCV